MNVTATPVGAEASNVSTSNPMKPLLSRTMSRIDIPYDDYNNEGSPTWKGGSGSPGKLSLGNLIISILSMRSSAKNKRVKRLLLLISLNVAYSTVELFIGLLSGRVGLVSDAFHLTFGCGLLSFSLFSMAVSGREADTSYTYGYKRLEVLSAFTNALFLLFMAFSLAVEALHSFIQDESEHKHYLIISAVTNLTVNLIGVWFFRSYARIDIVYRNGEDMNCHSVCLHVLADSLRSGGVILAMWLVTIGVENAEAVCLGLVGGLVFVMVVPLFKRSGGILVQTAPPGLTSSSSSSSTPFGKCWRQVVGLDGVSDVVQVRFWELVPGDVVGSVSVLVGQGADEGQVVRHVHSLYHDLGVHRLTVQVDLP